MGSKYVVRSAPHDRPDQLHEHGEETSLKSAIHCAARMFRPGYVVVVETPDRSQVFLQIDERGLD